MHLSFGAFYNLVSTSISFPFNFDSPINDNLIVDTSFDGTFLLIRYNNGEVIRLNVTDLVGYEA